MPDAQSQNNREVRGFPVRPGSAFNITMKAAFPLILVFSCFLCALPAQQPPAAPPAPAVPPADLKTLMDRRLVAHAAIAAERANRISEAKMAYTPILDNLQKDATTRGDLDAVLSVKTERDRLDRELTADEKKTLAVSMRAARARYDQAIARAAAVEKAAEIASLREYVATLDALQKRTTQSGDIDGALKVRAERTDAAGKLAAIEAAKQPAPAAAAVVEPVKPGAPAKLAAPIEVAAEIKAKGEANGTGPGVVVFDGPTGNGRRGAKGVLLKNEPVTGRNGTTWSFRYARSGTDRGVQIIHPHGRGQVIIYLQDSGIGVSTPKAWIEVGYGGGNPKAVKNTRVFDEVFPLANSQEYQVESRVSPTGAVQVSIDGKLVATARATGASPLSLEILPDEKFPGSGRGTLEFKGAELPLRWGPGYAGIIMGPLDNGQNVCREVRFQASVPEPGSR